jgi:hypothetical protein
LRTFESVSKARACCPLAERGYVALSLRERKAANNGQSVRTILESVRHSTARYSSAEREGYEKTGKRATKAT